MLTPGQCWLKENIRGWHVLEFRGMVKQRLSMRKWNCVKKVRCPDVNRADIYTNYELTIDTESQAMGAGTSTTYEYS